MLSGPRYRPTTSQKIWESRESNLGHVDPEPRTLTTRLQRPSQLKQTKTRVSGLCTPVHACLEITQAVNLQHVTSRRDYFATAEYIYDEMEDVREEGVATYLKTLHHNSNR
jgi:hypothetical protein